jgi:hypothetical protein
MAFVNFAKNSIMHLAVVLYILAASFTGCQEPGKTDPKEGVGPSQSGLVAPAQIDSTNFTSIEWKEKTLNFGTINQGQKLEVVFHFKNTGTKPLVISKVEPSCGCTVVDTPTEPIAPGKEGMIKGAFDSHGREGSQYKTIYVHANTKGGQMHELLFIVDVKTKS